MWELTDISHAFINYAYRAWGWKAPDAAELSRDLEAIERAAVKRDRTVMGWEALERALAEAQSAAIWLEAEADHPRPGPHPAMRGIARRLHDALAALGSPEARDG